MSNLAFEHLHTHSHFSLLDGLSTINAIVERAFEMDRTSVCVTDHGTIGGVPELFRMAKEYGLKPIAGMEAYFCESVKVEVPKGSRAYNHLVLLARNLAGYQNLCRLVTKSNRDGFYKKPRIDYDMLEEHKDGLIVLSACIGGVPQEKIIAGDPKGAAGAIDCFMQILGKDSFILEMQDTEIPEQKIVNLAFESYARKGLRVCATVDSHYTYCGDAEAHDTLLCVGTRAKLTDDGRFKFNGTGYHYKHPSEMYDIFDAKYLQETRAIADMCEVYAIPKTGSMPDVPIPDGFTTDSYLEKLAHEGLNMRGLGRKPNYAYRLKKELETVRGLNYSGYFIMVHNMLEFARGHGILVGPGRGSSAGSLLAYCLEITQVDPIRYGLFFERFLNKDRISPPDIDVDVADSGRQQVLSYVRDTFGVDRVAHIGSYSTLGPRQAIRDVITVHGWPEFKVNELLRHVPDDPMLKYEDVKQISAIKNGLGDKLLGIVSAIAGKNRHNSTHAAGVIVSNGNLTEELPLVRSKDGHSQTLYSYDELSKLGYIKFDILGLTTLGIIDRVCKTAQVDIKKLWALEDPQAYDLLCRGETVGVFQLEGRGYQTFTRRYKPREFEDIMMINALYRPGPMQGGEGLETILRRRGGQEEPEYVDMALEPILKWTYGMPVYQEQIMAICVELAGFTLSKADSMRSAIGKKKEEEIAALKAEFVRGCVSKGRPVGVAEKLYSDIEYFARYGWNKAHAAAYGMVTYATAYLKTHHPAQFMAETLNSANNPDRMKILVFETRRMGIRFIKPNINESATGYSVPRMGDSAYGQMSVMSGLASVKGIGEKVAMAIMDERSRGKFYSLKEFRDRLPRKTVNSRMYGLLEQAGAMTNVPAEPEEVPF